MENNYLSDTQEAEKTQELNDCGGIVCDAQTRAKWLLISQGQNATLTAGVVSGIPVALYEGVEGIVSVLASPIESYNAIKQLLQSDDAFSTVSDSVKQSYIDRINKLELEYQRAGAGGSYNAGVEVGKLFTDVAALAAGGAGLVKVGAKLTQKITAIAKGGGAKVDNVLPNQGNKVNQSPSNGVNQVTKSEITAENFFQDAKYSNKVKDQATWKDNHGFPEVADQFAKEGKVTEIKGRDGNTYWKLEIEGEYKGKSGVFEYIKDADGKINHRLFVPKK